MIHFTTIRSKFTWISFAGLFLLAIGGMALAQSGRPPPQGGWQQEWDRTLSEAKKEGQLTIYIFRYGAVLDAFKKDFPEIKVVSVTGTGSQLGTRIAGERRGEKYLADVFGSGANTIYNILYKNKGLEPLKPALLLPEVVDASKWYGGEHRYADDEQKYIFAYIANPSWAQLNYNTNLFNPRDLKSFWDLLDPKWKGKIVSLDPKDTTLGGTMVFLYHHPGLGPDFLKRFFGGMDITFSKDRRQMTDWLAQGKYPICMGCDFVQRAKQQGLPIDTVDTSAWKEGAALSVSGGTIGLVNRAPHPNAAKVFVNWFLSRKGQIALQKLGNPDNPPNSRRIDIPKDELPAENKLVERRKYLDVTRPEWQDMAPIFKLADEIRRARAKE
jgi:iron(III) transport system substrate-binding protein